jgi:A/G-specific adenine glycosylase
MLQQTRVGTAIAYYERFLARFPSCEALAVAEEAEVLREWAGLGYYARARNLWRAARRIARDHGGRIPREARALTELPGVGRYTAGALRSIAFGEPAAVVDGNVSRVLARLQGLRSPRPADLWSLAEALVPPDRPGEFNQALMELGSTVCAPRGPACARCPLRSLCRARREGDPERFPSPRRRPPPRAIRATACVIRHPSRDGAVLLARRPPRGLLAGLWELPSVEGTDLSALTDVVRERFGIRARPGPSIGSVRHLFSHRRLTLRVVELRYRSGRPTRGRARWCTSEDLPRLPLSALARKSLPLAGLRAPPLPGTVAP